MNISAIVPAYNEQKTICRVIDDLLKVSFIDEIIVIDDGSEDGTADILNSIESEGRVKIIFNKVNKGKGFSVAQGLRVSTGSLILILDADIINYTESDLRLLIEPLLSDEVAYTMKMTDDKNTKFTSGVRAYWKKDLAPLLKEMEATTRYGLEVLLNARLEGKNGVFVTLHDYKHFQKFDKHPLPKAIWEYIKEGGSILAQKIKQQF